MDFLETLDLNSHREVMGGNGVVGAPCRRGIPFWSALIPSIAHFPPKIEGKCYLLLIIELSFPSLLIFSIHFHY